MPRPSQPQRQTFETTLEALSFCAFVRTWADGAAYLEGSKTVVSTYGDDLAALLLPWQHKTKDPATHVRSIVLKHLGRAA